MHSGYNVKFEGNAFTIWDSKTGLPLAQIQRTRNNMFLLEASKVGLVNIVTSEKEEAQLWHKRYGHLSNKGIQLLDQKRMLLSMLSIKEVFLV